ncbi:alpha/beta fold hydrolase [Cellulomonas sp. Leaf334]|uniref:alpha/beta fold hydrolase n=1 Tax=Cellulomonas sp. Leaf334 TaxID=1736339 RepID=UPI0006FD9A5A|nr:alpha/beta hydrolase [Cellulomonas sp. Leaf334]KQR10378.1 hydrolase [Cellulomonas sp. Leaf334]
MPKTTQTLDVPGATLAYDVRGALPAADGRLPLLLVGQPMDASGFGTLASWLPDRTIVTYDPRGLGRSTRSDGDVTNTPQQQAEDLHALIGELGGTVDLFGSSGGAVTGLHLVATYPDDVGTFVAHEPPVLAVLPDAEQAFAAERRVQEVYRDRGWGAGMAAFIALTSVQGEFTSDFGRELPTASTFGLPADDDGSRVDPLLSGASNAVTAYRPDVAALTAGSARVVVAGGIESHDTLTWRTSAALADALGQELTVFPSNHGGFLGGEFGQEGQPEAFAARLREILDAAG